MTLKLLFVTPSFHPATFYGGPVFSTHALANALARRPDVELRVLTTDANGPGRTVAVASRPMTYPEGYEVYFARCRGGREYSLELPARLWPMIRWADAIHLTAVYSQPTIPTLAIARLLGKPLLWSPRGALLASQNWADAPRLRIKRIWEMLCAGAMGRRTALHVTSEAERDASLARLPRAGAVIVPNGVDIPAGLPPREWMPDGTLRLMFLGRLHPIKAIENLLRALEGKSRITLDIHGEGDAAYVESLRAIATAAGVSATFHGHVESDAKLRAFMKADICVVPSHSENFSMVVVEALAHGVPVIVSRGAPWQEVEAQGCGLWVDNAPSSLAAAIETMRGADLPAMGARGRAWMEAEYGWNKRADEMIAAFTSI